MHWIVPPKQKLFCILTACCITGIFVNALAQTAPITSSGLNTQISGPIAVDGNVQYNITGGTRAGQNLFHSFGKFGVPDNNIANFLNNSGLETANILGRVTGGNESQIFGTIRTSGFDSANLFLMNPAGFLFGPNATLDVGGMASFTSADYLRLSDGKHNGYFYADPAKPSLLTAYPVAAFGFLGPNSASIAIQGGNLEVANGKTLSFVGGPRDFTTDTGATVPSGVSMSGGSLAAPNGLIYMATVSSRGEVLIPALSGARLGRLDPPSSATATIRIRSGGFVMDHSSLTVTNTSQGEQSAIKVTVQGVMELKNDSSIISSTDSAEDGADIHIATAALKMNHAEVTTETAGSKKAGSVEIHALESIHTTDSYISSVSNSTAEDAGSGGHILLKAPLVEIYGGGLSSVVPEGGGDAGDITVQTGVLNLSASDGTGAEINASSYGPGQGGTISIFGATGPDSRASDVTLSGQSSVLSETSDSRGDAGSISVKTVRLTLTEGSDITTASRGSAGNAGNITLNATESILLSGSFVTSETLEGSIGHGRNISITTNNLTVSQNADGKGGRISTSTQASGDAGTVTINADRVLLTEGGRLSSSSSHQDSLLPPPGGAAGAVLVQGINGAGSRAKSIDISGRDAAGKSSGIFTDTQGTGIGGGITLHANTLTVQNGGTISAETLGAGASAIGGTITVNANHVQLRSGALITATSNGAANAGDINITATDGLTMQNSSIVLQNSRILAQADHGRGGQIKIRASVLEQDATSVVNADAERGVNGTVTIQALYGPAGGKVQPLGNRPLQAASLLNQRCAAVAGGRFSSFTVAGRNSLPTEPGGWLSSPLALVTPEPKASTMATSRLQASRYEPMGERSLLSLRQLTPQRFLIQAFAEDTHKGCKS